MECYHEPVLLEEVIKFLDPKSDHIYLDATVGTGGHAEVILEKSVPGGRLIGIDTDLETLEIARKRLVRFGNRCILIHGRYEEAGYFLNRRDIDKVDGIVMDLGISSYQLETRGRGFSFQRDDPLDMRMDRTTGMTAEQLLRSYSEEEISRILKEYGQERWARRIAKAIKKNISTKKELTTMELARIVCSALPKKKGFQRIHPATKTFQALRIAVNRELDALKEFLEIIPSILNKGGRACIISFHSLEDRIVKRAFLSFEKGCRCGPDLPECICGRKPVGRLLSRKAIRPTSEEIKRNKRSRSARMRIMERL